MDQAFRKSHIEQLEKEEEELRMKVLAATRAKAAAKKQYDMADRDYDFLSFQRERKREEILLARIGHVEFVDCYCPVCVSRREDHGRRLA